jgi:hypothetical protein
MKTLDIYIDLLFLKKFFENKPTNNETQQFRDWLDFFVFLSSPHLKFIDVKDGKEKQDLIRFLEQPHIRDNFFATLQADITNYYFSINYNFGNNTTIKNPHSVFFIEFSEAQIAELSKKYGYCFVNFQTYTSTWKKFNPRNYQNSISVSALSRDFNHWNYMVTLKHSFNSMLLIDRYLFAETGFGIHKVVDNYKSNLKQLFQYFVPKNDAITVTDITIISSTRAISPSVTLAQIATYLQTQVFAVLFPQSKFNLSIILVDNVPDTHDRRIITNYFDLHSGDSFMYVTNAHNNHIKVDTSLHIYTFFSGEQLKDATKRINDIRGLVLGANSANNFIGNKQNRLLK